MTISRFRTRTIAELLGILALRPGRTFHREELGEVLWPEADPEVSRSRLMYALATLRKQVEPMGVPWGSVLSCGRNDVCLNANAVTSDVEAFEDALALARTASDADRQFQALLDAVDLYGGSFMPGYYSDWAETHRRGFAETFTASACRLAKLALDRGDVESALRAAQRAVEADRFCETAYQCLISAHLAAGNRVAAIQEFHRLEVLLADEMGVAPSAATRALLDVEAGAMGRGTGAIHRPPAAPGSARAADPAEPSVSLESPAAEERQPVMALPEPFTRFIGRQEEIAQVVTLLRGRDHRLITLTGAGGIGKTRLGIEAVRQFAAGEPVRIAYVELVNCSDARLIPSRLVEALGLGNVAGTSPLDQITACLSGGPALVVFDNFEHLIGPGRGVLRELLTRIESLTCLVTSRLPLELPGECVLAVSPLPVPPAGVTPEAALQEASVELFVDRARFVRPDFTVTERNADQLAAICRQLEGYPLAIELAAAWFGTLSLREIAERLHRPLEMLVSRRKDFAPRHRTIRRTLEQSFDLLPPHLGEVFPALAVFRGGWTLEAAEAIITTENVAAFIDGLRRAGIVTACDTRAGTRYRLLEVVREFAEEHLSEPLRQDVERRHAEHFRDLAMEAQRHLGGPRRNEWLEALSAEEANFAAAAERCLGPGGDVATGISLAEAVWCVWHQWGYRAESCRWLTALLREANWPTGAMRARALGFMAAMEAGQGRLRESYDLLLQAVDLQRNEHDQRLLGFNLSHLGRLALLTGDAAGFVRCHEESLVILRGIPYPWGIAVALGAFGNGLSRLGRHEEARRYLLESVTAYRALEDATATATSLGWLADAHFRAGGTLLAEACACESLAIRRAQTSPREIGYGVVSLSRILASDRRDEESLALAEEALSLLESQHDQWGIAAATHCRGLVVSRTDPPAGLRLLRGALEIRVRLTDVAEVAESLEAIAICGAGREALPRTVLLLACAARLREEVGMPVYVPDAADLEMARDHVRNLLGEEEYTRVWDDGRRMALEEAVACAHLHAA